MNFCNFTKIFYNIYETQPFVSISYVYVPRNQGAGEKDALVPETGTIVVRTSADGYAGFGGLFVVCYGGWWTM